MISNGIADLEESWLRILAACPKPMRVNTEQNAKRMEEDKIAFGGGA